LSLVDKIGFHEETLFKIYYQIAECYKVSSLVFIKEISSTTFSPAMYLEDQSECSVYCGIFRRLDAVDADPNILGSSDCAVENVEEK
jgi:hypothetical protein